MLSKREGISLVSYISGPGPIPGSNLTLGTSSGQALPGPYGAGIFLPTNYGTITDGGFFGDGLSHTAVTNGFSTLAALQTKFQAATFTATGSGTTLTVSSVVGALYAGLTLETTTGIGSGITIVQQLTGTFSGAGTYLTSSATTISAAAGAASWASATSNQMTGLMIQASIHASHVAGGGRTYLSAGHYYNLPQGFVFPPATGASLIGVTGAAILCSVCGTNSGFSFFNLSGCDIPITALEIWGADTKNFGSVPGDGTANTGIFTAGTSAINYSGCLSVVLRNLLIQNFDQVVTFNSVGGNYMSAQRDITVVLCNKAFPIDNPSAPNSYERMSYDNCSSGSCNWGAYLILNTGGASIAADVYFTNTSFDYSCVRQIEYQSGTGFDLLSFVCLTACHIENSSSVCGMMAFNRIVSTGNLKLEGCYWFETGANPTGLIVSTFTASAQSIYNSFNGVFFTSDANAVPFVDGSNGGGTNNTQGGGNTGRNRGNIALLFKTAGGAANSVQPADIQAFTQNGTASTINFGYPTSIPIPVLSNTTVSLPDFGTTPFVTGTTFAFIVAPGATLTFAALNGSVTLVSSGVGNTAGAASKPAMVFASTYDSSHWSLSGQMT